MVATVIPVSRRQGPPSLPMDFWVDPGGDVHGSHRDPSPVAGLRWMVLFVRPQGKRPSTPSFGSARTYPRAGAIRRRAAPWRQL